MDKQKIFENAKNQNPMLRVYDYHGITEEQFEEQYKNIPVHIKAYAKETLIVEYYNKGWKPNWNNTKEHKYHVWFCFDGKFHLSCVLYDFSASICSARLCFKEEKDAFEAVEVFFEVFKESRTF